MGSVSRLRKPDHPVGDPFPGSPPKWWDQEGKAAGRAWPLCLAGVGPYGAYLADGSGPGAMVSATGNCMISISGGPSCCGKPVRMCCCSRPSPGSRKHWWKPGSPGNWGPRSGSAFPAGMGSTTVKGTPLREAAEVVRQFPEVEALGVNCTKPEYIREPDRGTEGGFRPACFRVSQQRGRIRSGDQDLAWGGHGPEIRRLCPGIHGGRSRGRWRLLHHGGRAYPAGGPGPGTVPGRNP